MSSASRSPFNPTRHSLAFLIRLGVQFGGAVQRRLEALGLAVDGRGGHPSRGEPVAPCPEFARVQQADQLRQQDRRQVLATIASFDLLAPRVARSLP